MVVAAGAASEALASPDGCRVLYRDGSSMLHDVASDGTDDLLLGAGKPPYRGASPLVSPSGRWVATCTDNCFIHRFGGATFPFDPPAAPLLQTWFSADEQSVMATIYLGPVANGPNVEAYRGSLGSPIPFEGLRSIRFVASAGQDGFLRAVAERHGEPPDVQHLHPGGADLLASAVLWAIPVAGGAYFARPESAPNVSLYFVAAGGEPRLVVTGHFERPECANQDVGTGESVSPDGRRLLLLEWRQGIPVLVAVGPDHRVATVAALPEYPVPCGMWSRDGNRLLYRASRTQTRVHDFLRGADLPIDTDEGQRIPGLMTDDGRFVFTANRAVIEVDTGHEVHAGGEELRRAYYVQRGNNITWLARNGGTFTMFVFDSTAGRVFEDPLPSPATAVGSSGTRFLGGGPDSLVYSVESGGGKHLLRAFRIATTDFVTLADDMIDPPDRYTVEPRRFMAFSPASGGVALVPLP